MRDDRAVEPGARQVRPCRVDVEELSAGQVGARELRSGEHSTLEIRASKVRLELTERQREVLRLIAAGKTNAEIGEALGISLDGAKWHVSEILAKLGVSTREEAAVWWQAQNGIGPRVARALRSIIPASLWLRIGLGVAVVGGAAAVALGVIVLGDSGEKGGSSASRQVTGTIKSYTAATFSAPAVESSPAVVVLTDGTTFQLDRESRIFSRSEPLAMADLRTGNVVQVIAAARAADGSVVATRVELFSEPVASAALVGPAAGVTTASDGTLMVLGSISSHDATSLQLAFPGGATTVVCGSNCVVSRVIDTGPSDLQPGVRITVALVSGVADWIRFVQ